MDYTLFEINKHKMNICNLSNKLSNTFDINQEILINNEIKKETETIQSLLNIKQNLLSQNNNMNNMNNQQQNMMQQMEQQRIMQQEMERMKREEEEKKKNTIIVYFRKGPFPENGKSFLIECNLNEKISDIINRYRIISKDDKVSHEKFIFNAKPLNPGLTVAEAGLIENSNIFVVETKGEEEDSILSIIIFIC